MYKDRDKQREANRQAQAKRRATRIANGMAGLIEGMTKQGMTPNKSQGMTGHKGVTSEGVTEGVTITGESVAVAIKAMQDAQSKRGKDIKTFDDLPPDVQATINRISESNEEKQKRTKVAIAYQHTFPDRYHSTGIAI